MKRCNDSRRGRSGGLASPSKKLRQTRGEFTINGAFILLLVMALLVLFISVLGTVNDAMKLHSVTADLVRYIEIRGRVDAEVYTEMSRLANVAGVTIEDYSIDANYFSGNKIQFGDSFSVTLETTGYFGIGGVLSVPVPFSSTVTGRSEQYWK